MATAPPGHGSDRLPDARPARRPDRSVPGRHRAGSRRRLWASGVAAAVIGAGLVTPSLTATEASTVRPGAGQVLSEQAAVKAAPTRSGRRPAPTSPTATTSSTPTRTTTTTTAPTTPAPTTAAPTTTAPTTAAPTTATPTTAAPTTAAPTTAPTTTPASTTSAPTTAGTTGSPLAGDTFHGPNSGAAAAAEQPGTSPEDAALLRELAQVPTATWLGSWSGDVTATVGRVVAEARAAGRVPVFVAYNIPGRDCGGYSAGGVDSAAQYAQWVQGIANGIGTAEVVVVVEPDALAQLCGDQAARTTMLRSAVDVLERNPATHTYLDAGHSNWIDAATMAERLRAAGATGADGFALNVSNFQTTASNVSYGQQVSSLLGGVHFVVDTSRNGNGPGSDWCNPPGRAVGERPTGSTGHLRVDAFLWVKTPGESDGTCNGGPAAGTFWPSYAVALLRAAA